MAYVIIGNSAGGIGVVEGIRANDPEGAITMISYESHLAYSRPFIKHLLSPVYEDDRILCRRQGFYAKHRVRLLLGRRVSGLDVDRKQVRLEDGEEVPYEKLAIATGSSPIRPKIAGSDKAQVFNFMEWDEAKAVAQRLPHTRHVVILGGGLIAASAIEGMQEVGGVRVSIVELADRILGRILDREGAQLITDRLRQSGVEVHLETTIEEVLGDGVVKGVRLATGQTLACDMIIMAVGVRPNVDVVQGTPIRVDRGILVNAYQETSVAGVYACGDVAEAYSRVDGKPGIIAIWPVAYRQGRIAGYNMAGVRRSYPGGIATNSIHVSGVPAISMGLVEAHGDEYEVLSEMDRERAVYKKVILKDDVMVGGIFINQMERAGIYSRLVYEGKRVTAFKDKLLRDDFGFVHMESEYRKGLLEQPA